MGCIQSSSDEYHQYFNLPELSQSSNHTPAFVLEREIRIQEKIREYGDLTLCVFSSGEFVVHSGCTPATWFDLNGSSFWTIHGVQSISLKDDNLYCLCTDDMVQIYSSQAKLIRVIQLLTLNQEINSNVNNTTSELASPRIIVSQTSSDFIVQYQSKPSLPLKIYSIVPRISQQYAESPQRSHDPAPATLNLFYIPEWSTFSHIFCNIHVCLCNHQSSSSAASAVLLSQSAFSFDPNIKLFEQLDNQRFIVLDWLNSVRTCHFLPPSKAASQTTTPTQIQTTMTPFKNVTSIAVRKLRCLSLPAHSTRETETNETNQSNLQLYVLCENRLFIYSVVH